MFRVVVDPDSLAELRSGSVGGAVHLEVEGVAFPEVAWWDFPPTILGWWLKEVSSAVDGRRFELLFMDGPFRVSCRVIGEDVQLRFLRRRVEREVEVGEGGSTVSEMRDEIRAAARAVAERCLQRGLPTGGLDRMLGLTR